MSIQQASLVGSLGGLRSIWDSLTPDERRLFLHHNPQAAPIVDPLTWMKKHTKTKDEERSLIPLDYCWTLWEQQDEYLKQLWPIDRPRDKQAYNIMEFKNGSRGVAVPGEKPDKIRGYHPPIFFF